MVIAAIGGVSVLAVVLLGVAVSCAAYWPPDTGSPKAAPGVTASSVAGK